ncbi:hypothetical protein ACOJBO_03870 [Rhizobium beringeri]
MEWLERFGYRLDLRRLGMAALILALVFFVARLAFKDSLTLGYAMVVPSYVFLSATLEGARIQRGGFRDSRGWAGDDRRDSPGLWASDISASAFGRSGINGDRCGSWFATARLTHWRN